MDYKINMEEKDTNVNRLSPAELKKFETLLWAKRNEILGNVSTMEFEALRRERSDLSIMPTHLADMGTNNYEIDNILGLMDSERKILIQIDIALSNIEDGTYGICEMNGEMIPKARLEAIPWARYCITCAGLIEKGLIVEDNSFYIEEELLDEFNSDHDDNEDD